MGFDIVKKIVDCYKGKIILDLKFGCIVFIFCFFIV